MVYHITSTAWEGYIEIEFNDALLMVRTDTTNAELSEVQQRWFLQQMPKGLEELKRVMAGTSARLTEVVSEVTFEMIWNRYDYKVGKKEAMAKWSRMTRPEQWKAYNFVARYKSRKPDGQAQLYLASYLNKERWND